MSKRLKRLEENQIVKYKTAINIQKYDLHHGIILIEINDVKAKHEIIRCISKCPFVEMVFDVTGWKYHLMVCCVAPEQQLLNQFLTYSPFKYLNCIKKVETYHTMLNPQFPVFIPVSTKVFETCGKNCTHHQTCGFDECPGCPVGNNVEIVDDELSESAYSKS